MGYINAALTRQADTVEIDVLTGQCLADGQMLLSLTISEAMRSWFAARLVQYRISPSLIEVAQLTVEYQAKKVERKDIPLLVPTKTSLWSLVLKIFGREPSNNIPFKCVYQPGKTQWDIESEFFVTVSFAHLTMSILLSMANVGISRHYQRPNKILWFTVKWL